MTEATRKLAAARRDVWALVAEPYHLPDWWPAYTGVRPDRRGLAEGARWQVVRTRTPGFLSRPGGQALIEIRRVAEGSALTWHDVGQGIEAGILLETAGQGETRARAYVDGPAWRILVAGARGYPREALARLHDLCQTAASL